MESRIETLREKKLVGMHLSMTLAANRTTELWKSFMARRKEIMNAAGADLFSLQVYDPSLEMQDFGLGTPFEKWATTEVADFENIPDGMEPFTLPGGLYAVFVHKGGPAKGGETFRYIFGAWVPQSGYSVDNSRPHFEIIGEKYKGDDPESEEEIWVPVQVIKN